MPILIALLIACAGLVACGDDGDPGATNNGATNNGATNNGGTNNGGTNNGATNNGATNNGQLPEGCDVLVGPSDDDQTVVQTALIEVEDGQTVCFDEGTFRFRTEVSLSVDNVTLRGTGSETTILDFSDQDVGGNGVSITSDHVTVESLQVRNTPGDGIRATDVDGITFRGVFVTWDAEDNTTHGAYGLYPVGSQAVLIEDCVVSGASDAGIYVGQSNQVIVRDSEAYDNVAGIEIENTNDADVYRNHSHNNSGGIAIFDLPGLAQQGSRAKVHDNLVEDNNTPNFGKEGSTVSQIPAGSGMFILSCDYNEVHDNIIKNNDSVGIAIVNYQSLFGDFEDEDFEQFAEGNWVHNNEFENNGTDPQGVAAAITTARPIPSLVWGGCVNPDIEDPGDELRNCLSDNGDATYLNIGLCGGGGTDIAELTCEGTALPAIALD
jgi:parallel beta-helix repeat protein